MTTDMTAPATKLDMKMLMDEIVRLYHATERWKDEMKLHFDFSVEQIKESVKMINMEKIKNHDDRITHLEVITGIRS